MRTVAVLCPQCHGASADNRLPPCLECNCNGHLYVNRMPDGSVPATWDDGRPMREWVPLLLPDTPVNPLVLFHARTLGARRKRVPIP